jgi:hypothetical protein
MNIDSIRDGLVTRLATISGLRTHPRVPDLVEPPAAFVNVTGVVYGNTFDGACTVRGEIVLLVARVDGNRGQENLDDYLNTSGAKSVSAAIAGDLDLAGAAHSVQLTEAQDYGGSFLVGDIAYIGCRFVWEALSL